MARVYSKTIEECGEDCPSFKEDAYAFAIHGCDLCDDDLTAERFQELARSGKKFPDFCPLPTDEEHIARVMAALVPRRG